jgi:hypothetical protein
MGSKHGMTATPTYKTWVKMKERCTSPNADQWKWYGGKGIRVCDRWLNSFEDFYADMGERPVGTTLDRIESTGNYEPGNCRWADKATQALNASHVLWVECEGESIPLKTLCRKKKISFDLVYGRMRAGYSLLDALSKQLGTRRPQPVRLCSIDGCGRKHKGHGLCHNHLNYAKKAAAHAPAQSLSSSEVAA